MDYPLFYWAWTVWAVSHFLLIHSSRTVAEVHKYKGSKAMVIDKENTVKSARGFRRPKNKFYPFHLFWGLFDDITYLRIKCFLLDSDVKAGNLSFQESFLDNTGELFLLDLLRSSSWHCLLTWVVCASLKLVVPCWSIPRELQNPCGCKACSIGPCLLQGTVRKNLWSGSHSPLIHLVHLWLSSLVVVQFWDIIVWGDYNMPLSATCSMVPADQGHLWQNQWLYVLLIPVLWGVELCLLAQNFKTCQRWTPLPLKLVAWTLFPWNRAPKSSMGLFYNKYIIM